MSAPATEPSGVDFDALQARIHELGRTIIGPAAAEVDREGRFPQETFAALREARLLSCYVPTEHGGMGLSFVELGRICELLGHYCGSSAMIFAMHQIQVGCIVHHVMDSAFFQGFVAELVDKQLLLASATTELGIGGDVRSSRCAVEREGERFRLTKQAPVISYGLESDAILVTARRDPEAGASEQVHVMVRTADCQLEPLSTWDTLGFRGTCSLGFTLSSEGHVDQILPVPYGEIHAKTMHPFAHAVWASLWLGIAADAVHKARSVVRRQARKHQEHMPPSALRLAELDTVLFGFRNSTENMVRLYQERLDAFPEGPFPTDYGFALRMNNLKVTASQLLIEVVGKAMIICGIDGYRNDSKGSLGRHLRDAYGASLMVNNDRILDQSAPMQLLRREF